MTSPLTSLANYLSGKPARTPAQASPQTSPGGLGIVSAFNQDGTLSVIYNGATVTANTLKNFTPVAGQTVLVDVKGTQVWALGPTMGSIVNADGTSVDATKAALTGVTSITSMDGTVLIKNANGPTTDLSVPNALSSNLVFNVRDYGTGVGQGTAVDQPAIEAAIAAAAAAGGGIIYFPVGLYLITSTIDLPISTQVSTAAANPFDSSVPIYQSPPLRFTGLGGAAMPRGDQSLYGAIIQFKPSSNMTMINGFGEGYFEFDHLTVQDTSPSFGASGVFNQNLFFYFNNTASNIHDNAFVGNNGFIWGCTDLVQYGPDSIQSQVTGNTRGDAFGTYLGGASKLVNNTLSGMRHLAQLYYNAQGITMSGNFMDSTCGTSGAGDACVNFIGPGCTGNLLENNTFAMGTNALVSGVLTAQPIGYAYVARFYQAFQNTAIGNNVWLPYIYAADPTVYPSAQSVFWFASIGEPYVGQPDYVGGTPAYNSGAYQNTIIEGTRPQQNVQADGVANPYYLPWGSGNTYDQINVRAALQLSGPGIALTDTIAQPRAGDGQYFVQAGDLTVITSTAAGQGPNGGTPTGTSGTSTGGSQAYVTFPNPFPQGCLAVVATSSGDANAADSRVNWVGQVFNATPYGFWFFLQNYPSPYDTNNTNGALCAVTYIAIGY